MIYDINRVPASIWFRESNQPIKSGSGPVNIGDFVKAESKKGLKVNVESLFRKKVRFFLEESACGGRLAVVNAP
jgi:hypothetical protein